MKVLKWGWSEEIGSGGHMVDTTGDRTTLIHATNKANGMIA